MPSMKAMVFGTILSLAAAETVCVTGASGFVATEIVKQLLETGYHVQGTVRSLTQLDKFAHLRALDVALPGKLTLTEADLLIPGSFDACAQGASAVIHTASPFHFESTDMEKEMLLPAVEGTRNVMNAAKKAGITKVVLTSSLAAVTNFDPTVMPQRLLSEEDYNEQTGEDVWGSNPAQAYFSSKSLAEKTAETMAKEYGIDLMVVCPSLVMGPVLTSRPDGFSVNFMLEVLKGNPLGAEFPWCDIRDVAKLHIAGLADGIKGRYIVSTPSAVVQADVARVLAKTMPDLKVAQADKVEYPAMLDNSKTRALIGELTPIDSTIADMARSLRESGMAKPPLIKSEL